MRKGSGSSEDPEWEKEGICLSGEEVGSGIRVREKDFPCH